MWCVVWCGMVCCCVLYCTVLCCTVLYCTVLHCTVLYPLECSVLLLNWIVLFNLTPSFLNSFSFQVKL